MWKAESARLTSSWPKPRPSSEPTRACGGLAQKGTTSVVPQPDTLFLEWASAARAIDRWPACKDYTVWLFDTLTDEKRAANNSKSWEMKGLENLSHCSHCSHPKGQGMGGTGAGRMSESLLAGAIIYLRPGAPKREAGKWKLEIGKWGTGKSKSENGKSKIQNRKSKIPGPYLR